MRTYNNLLVSGSLAYDRIMDFGGRFRDHILPSKLHLLNLSFQVRTFRESFG
ncbi:MAG: carbohydrate kinase family protein, partial [Patescibacteria group bacterium]